MALSQRLYRIKGVVQHYSWGGYEWLPSLLGMDNSQKKPFAEYWLGAHPNFPSLYENMGLDQLINGNKTEILGEKTAKVYGSLPYLFKILDVRQMLSIQVHPTREEARRGFEKENSLGIPIHAYNRIYKDENHKPELMVALGDFWLLHGFRSADAMKKQLESIPELSVLSPLFEEHDYQELYTTVMMMEQEEVNDLLNPLLQKVLSKYNEGKLKKDDPSYWAAKAAINFKQGENIDRGIFSIYFLNLVHLKKGEGIYQPPGMLHSYLEGQNIEIMANSDNVLRAGLTDKYINIPELLTHVDYSETVPEIFKTQQEGAISYKTNAPEFALDHYLLDRKDVRWNTQSAEIIFVPEGKISVSAGEEEEVLQKGEALLIASNTEISIQALIPSEVFRVSTP